MRGICSRKERWKKTKCHYAVKKKKNITFNMLAASTRCWAALQTLLNIVSNSMYYKVLLPSASQLYGRKQINTHIGNAWLVELGVQCWNRNQGDENWKDRCERLGEKVTRHLYLFYASKGMEGQWTLLGTPRPWISWIYRLGKLSLFNLAVWNSRYSFF